MKFLPLIVLVCLGAAYAGPLNKRTINIDMGDFVEECDQEPMELGIVLDSSRSIQPDDFTKTKKFLHDFLDHFFIGDGHDDVRVSIITFGEGIYPQDGFDLTTYKTKEAVLNAIMNIPHEYGKRTDTGLAIDYMRDHQLIPSVTRSWAEKLAVVVTDGNSQRGDLTEQAAVLARERNITMYAVGIGSVTPTELDHIAGDHSRVTQVESFDSLDSVKTVLARKTCIKKAKPTTTTTTPMPQTACGILDPADINFVFSPADMGLDGTAWTTSFISRVIDGDEMDIGFRYGAVSGSCPDDTGFALDAYSDVESIRNRLMAYDQIKLPSLAVRTREYGFSEANGGRDDSRKVAVLFASGGKKGSALQAEVDQLVADGVQVYIASPEGRDINIPGAQGLFGGSSREQAEAFVSLLCPY